MTPHAGTHVRRRAGLLIPLFSCHSSRGWGIGEFGDLPPLADWMREAGLSLLQILPLYETAPGQTSPYSSISTMALDPIFIHVPDVPDYEGIGGDGWLGDEDRARLGRVRESGAINYRVVHDLKERALRACFDHFMDEEWERDSARAGELRAFAGREAWWLYDYAMFRAVAHVTGRMDWRAWPEGLRRRDADALSRVGGEHGREILYRQYLQWIAHTQWEAARHAAAEVKVYGDFPFMAATDSADSWAKQRLLSFDVDAGAPPDAFSKDGQNWKLPVYRWDAVRASGYDWFYQRARRAAELAAGFRVDHVVGLFRTWVFPHDGSAPRFVPADEAVQLVQGRDVLAAIQRAGAEVIAEDLGTIPDFVRTTLADLGIPGYKVLRWERLWEAPGQPLVDPLEFPPASLATSGTHDTETLAEWWAAAPADERRAVLALAAARHPDAARPGPAAPFVPAIRDALLELLFESGSGLLVLPIQDVFGWTHRVNVPAVVDDRNWTWKLPWPVDRLADEAEAQERQRALRGWSRRHGRLEDPPRP